MAEIRVRNLHKTFGDFAAVRNASFTVADGGFFVVLGPSGAGKTTTLRMIAGLELPTSGEIVLGGEDVTRRRAARRDIAFVFQHPALYPHMNVRQNIAYPLRSEGVARAEIRRRVEETARLLRMDHLIDSPVSRLSGGDRQRVALGRAVVRRPKAFLMDEPLGALDAELRTSMGAELRGLHARLGATTVYLTHDQHEAMSMADRIAVMNAGAIEQSGTPREVYDRPATMFVADFIGTPPMNLLAFHAGLKKGRKTVKLSGATIEVPELREDVAPRDLALGIRPEHVGFDDKAKLRGRVFGTEYLGSTQIVTLETSHGPLKARLPSDIHVGTGETVGVKLIGERLSLFDRASGRALSTALYEDAARG
jgi:multiple sugar transport system ATP-binding protein